MTGQNRIIAFGSGAGEAPADETPLEQDSDRELLLTDTLDDGAGWTDEDGAERGEHPAPVAALVPMLAAVAALAWSAFFVWGNWQSLRQGVTPAGMAGMIGDWSAPMMLIGIAWLLAMRSSRREAGRFGDAARLLSQESERLETRLLTVNRELSLAREFIAAQSRDLEALGRIAADRLSHNADRLQALIGENGDRVETLGAVSEAALENMEKLRGQLPVIASSAKDLTNNIANAGRVAHAQIEEMIGGFKRLNEFGHACGREVVSLRESTAETIAEFQRHCSQMEETATARFAAIAEQGAEFRTRLELHEVEALAAIRTRATALGEELAETRRLLKSDEADRLASLREQLTTLRDEGGAVSQSLLVAGRQALDDWKSGLAAFDADSGATLASVQDAVERVTESAQARLHDVETSAQRIDTQLADSGQNFSDGLARLRDETQESNSRWIDALSQRLAVVSREISQRGLQLGRDLDRQHDELQARHEQIMADLAEKNAALDALLAERATALLEQVELNQGKVGDSHAGLLASLSQGFEALQTEAGRRVAWISEEIERRRGEFAVAEEQAIASLRDLLATMDQEIAERLANHEQQGAAIARRTSDVTAEMADQEQRLAGIAARGEASQARISAGLQSITSGASQAQSLLERTEEDIAELTDSSVRLLELIQASASNTRSELPEALGQAEQRLSALESAIARLREALDQAAGSGDAIAGQISSTDDTLNAMIARSQALGASIGNQTVGQAEAIAALLQGLKELEGGYEQLAGKAREDLSQALDTLSRSAHQAVAAIGETGANGISELAGRLGSESAEAIDRAIRNAAAEASGKLEQAAAHASGVSREAVIQLRDQLAKVNELVGNLEQRVVHARARAEDQVDNDFARRVALITESLNSNSIDIAKALSTEVSDTAWASYLRGDRGIFTRRAVSLIEASEVKAIQQIYERDQDFREHVSRYIHDFEAILRQVLSTRDGHALGVTLLSSDMGKLYVALAQGIERLRD